jgi:hypothetical protein
MPMTPSSSTTVSPVAAPAPAHASAPSVPQVPGDYAIALQRMIEHAARHQTIPEAMAAESPHLAQLLNDLTARTLVLESTTDFYRGQARFAALLQPILADESPRIPEPQITRLVYKLAAAVIDTLAAPRTLPELAAGSIAIPIVAPPAESRAEPRARSTYVGRPDDVQFISAETLAAARSEIAERQAAAAIAARVASPMAEPRVRALGGRQHVSPEALLAAERASGVVRAHDVAAPVIPRVRSLDVAQLISPEARTAARQAADALDVRAPERDMRAEYVTDLHRMIARAAAREPIPAALAQESPYIARLLNDLTARTVEVSSTNPMNATEAVDAIARRAPAPTRGVSAGYATDLQRMVEHAAARELIPASLAEASPYVAALLNDLTARTALAEPTTAVDASRVRALKVAPVVSAAPDAARAQSTVAAPTV